MTTCLIIPVYNRPGYLSRCMASVLALDEFPDKLIVIDDCSTDTSVTSVLNGFEAAYPGVMERYVTDRNRGIKYVLRIGFDLCFGAGYDLAINLDSDSVVAADFITRLKGLKLSWPEYIVSGFDSRNTRPNGFLRNAVILEGDGYAVKHTINGINMCFDSGQYDRVILPALLANGNWDMNVSDGRGFVHAVPSLVQHIGMNSSMGHDGEIPDYAADFKTVHMPDVTLFGIDAHNPAGLIRAAEISCIDIKFGGKRIITERLFSGRAAYSRWIIEHLHEQFTTSHVLIIHPDGYVLNPQAWCDDWLGYDYIGAVWEWYENKRVGNGGFCLRSKRFCELAAKLLHDGVITDPHPEDDVLCRQHREMFEDAGMIFAPDDVARKFSIEAFGNPVKKAGDQFGFHGGNLDMSGIPRWQQLNPGQTKYPAVERYLKQRLERRKGKNWNR